VIFEYKDEALPLLKQRNHAELTRGLISNTIVSKLRKFTSKKKTNTIIHQIIKKFHKAFKKYVWKPQCKRMVALEQQLNITNNMKFQYKSHELNNVTRSG
jgi:serine phosphatase RsbU (regulator of sigma subunit)